MGCAICKNPLDVDDFEVCKECALEYGIEEETRYEKIRRKKRSYSEDDD